MMIRYGKDEVLQAADSGHITGKSAPANLLPILEPRNSPPRHYDSTPHLLFVGHELDWRGDKTGRAYHSIGSLLHHYRTVEVSAS